MFVGKALFFAAALLVLAGCKPVTAPPPAGLPLERGPLAAPAVAEYDLGEAVVVQERFPEDSRFRNMPVRLNGLIGVPPVDAVTGEGGRHPVVVILHGTHPGCPVVGEVDVWPCDLAEERPNYRGFDYLVSALAANGYVALSININAENTFGFGEPTPGERLGQLLDQHLRALAEAAAGGQNDFGVELAGRADVRRLALFGHSRGGEMAFLFANDSNHPLGMKDGAENGGENGATYGPASGILLIAAAVVSVDPAGGSRVPMAIILPACDGDVIDQDGQHFYEAARLAPEQKAWATSAWLERANHNSFNAILPGDMVSHSERSDCGTLLEPETQRAWLVDYSLDFLITLFSHDPAAIRAAMIRLGMDVFMPAVTQLYGLPARSAAMVAGNNRLPLLVPATAEALTSSPAGGDVTAEGVTTLFCPPGFYMPATAPGTEPCRRVTVTVPGQPAHAVVTWEQAGGSLRFALPPGVGMLNFFDAVSLRAAIDPLSPHNAAGAAQGLSVQLTDSAGNTAVASTRPDEPALQYPAGEVVDDPFFGSLFTGRVPLTTIRLSLREFAGVNLMSIVEVALLFDGAPSGALFLADVELVRSPIGQQETLDAPPSAAKIAAAEAGDVEAMRQLANVYRPTEGLGVLYGNLERSVFWYREACAAGYANAQVDFYEFARTFAETASDAYLAEAIVCLEDAIAQGHRSAIHNGAFRAAFVDGNYARGFFLYALLQEADPSLAAQRQRFADQLTAAEIEEAEQAAAEWRAANTVKDYDDFFALVNSPFRPVQSQ
jgi:hypothetical protein